LQQKGTRRRNVATSQLIASAGSHFQIFPGQEG
jgi:hypothetical protein